MSQINPIPIDPREGGALNWIEMVDDQGRVVMEFMGPKMPRSPKNQEAWMIKMLREESLQAFFFLPLAHKNMNLDLEFIGGRETGWQGTFITRVSVPLAQLFLLPGNNHRQELADMKEFLSWVDEKRQGVGKEGREARLDWFRAGYRHRGLDWAGVENKSVAKQLNEELQGWQEKTWFENWYRANMDGFAKVRMGPHCWLSMPSLVPDRFWASLRAGTHGQKKKPHKP